MKSAFGTESAIKAERDDVTYLRQAGDIHPCKKMGGLE